MFVVKQPQAVWRLSRRRGPSAKEILISIHQRAQAKWQVEQKDKLKQQGERNADSSHLGHHLQEVLEVGRPGSHQALYGWICSTRDPELHKDVSQNHGQESQHQ